MNFDELMKLHGKRPRAHSRELEHKIQSACVEWFAVQFPNLRGRLVAVPNGGARSKAEAAKLKAEGVVAGVADLVLFMHDHTHGYGALFIEMKTPEHGSKQSDRQRWWQSVITEKNEYKYVVCRSLDDFMHEVRAYLNEE